MGFAGGKAMSEELFAEKTLADGRIARAVLTVSDDDQEASKIDFTVNGERLIGFSAVDPPVIAVDPFPLPWAKVGLVVSTPSAAMPSAHIDLEILPMAFGGGYVRGRVLNTNLRQTLISMINDESDVSRQLDDPFSLPKLDLSHLDDLPLYDLAQDLRRQVAALAAPPKGGKKPPKDPNKQKKCRSCRADCHIDALECAYTARKVPSHWGKAAALALCAIRYGKCWKFDCPDCR